MDRRICFFGGETRGSVRLANGHEDEVEVLRDVWFDQDIDGRWLVWVQEHDGRPTNGDDDGATGSIVVRNRDVVAFIEELDRLIAAPAAFAHEPEFFGAVGATNAPAH